MITLSRAQPVRDTAFRFTPELLAIVTVTGSAADTYQLQEIGNGNYSITQLPLNPNETYQLRITTSDGTQYISDSVIPYRTPPIDTVGWNSDSLGLNIYLNTHDPTNIVQYYRWDYTETWQREAYYTSPLQYINGTLVGRQPSQQISTCWETQNSTNLLLNTSTKLSQDVIYQEPIRFIPLGSEQVNVLYSIIVRQYGLSADAYAYWESLQGSTETTGSIFDPIPSTVTGNIHCVTHSNEIVLGYIGDSIVRQKRIFINRASISNWPQSYPVCVDSIIPPSRISDFADSAVLLPVKMLPDGNYFASLADCVDCRVTGGTTTKPWFWP